MRRTLMHKPLTEIAFVHDTNMGREISAELVAQPEARIDAGKAGADLAGGVGLAVEIDLDLRLQDQPVRNQQIVKGFEFGGEMPLAAHIPGEFDIEEVRGETLNAE